MNIDPDTPKYLNLLSCFYTFSKGASQEVASTCDWNCLLRHISALLATERTGTRGAPNGSGGLLPLRGDAASPFTAIVRSPSDGRKLNRPDTHFRDLLRVIRFTPWHRFASWGESPPRSAPNGFDMVPTKCYNKDKWPPLEASTATLTILPDG